jgi:membrane protease YdiL (CAAX protease family)
MNVTCCENNPLCFYLREKAPLDEWFPKDRTEQIKSFAIGIIIGLVAFLAVSGIFYLIQCYYPNFSISQDAIKIFTLFKDVHPFLDITWKAVMIVYVVIIGPALEEILFRGILNEMFKNKKEEGEESTCKKVMRVALVSLVFGACHLSPFQDPLSNLVIFVVTGVLGFILGMLKEQQNNLIAPTAAHMVFNLAGVL